MKFKNVTAVLLAFCLVAGCSGCSKNKKDPDKDISSKQDTSSKVTEVSETVSSSDTSDTEYDTDGTLEYADLEENVVMNIAGFDVSKDEYKYYFAYSKNSMDFGDPSFWDSDPDNENLNLVKQKTLDQLFTAYTIYKLASDNGVQLDEKENKSIEAMINAYKLYYESSYKQEKLTFDDYLKMTCCTEPVFKETMVREMLQSKLIDKLYGEDFKTNHLDDFYCAKYIQISPSIRYKTDENDDPTDIVEDFFTYLDKYTYTDEEKAAIDKINKAGQNKDKAAIKAGISELGAVITELAGNGTSFDELMDKYNMDGNQPEDENGYTGKFIKASSMPQEFSDAVKALDDNCVTDMIETDFHGYLIGYKVPFDDELFAAQSIDIFMSDENYPYQNRFNELTVEAQKKMKITFNNKYKDIDSSFASVTEEDEYKANKSAN